MTISKELPIQPNFIQTTHNSLSQNQIENIYTVFQTSIHEFLKSPYYSIFKDTISSSLSLQDRTLVSVNPQKEQEFIIFIINTIFSKYITEINHYLAKVPSGLTTNYSSLLINKHLIDDIVVVSSQCCKQDPDFFHRYFIKFIYNELKKETSVEYFKYFIEKNQEFPISKREYHYILTKILTSSITFDQDLLLNLLNHPFFSMDYLSSALFHFCLTKDATDDRDVFLNVIKHILLHPNKSHRYNKEVLLNLLEHPFFNLEEPYCLLLFYSLRSEESTSFLPSQNTALFASIIDKTPYVTIQFLFKCITNDVFCNERTYKIIEKYLSRQSTREISNAYHILCINRRRFLDFNPQSPSLTRENQLHLLNCIILLTETHISLETIFSMEKDEINRLVLMVLEKF